MAFPYCLENECPYFVDRCCSNEEIDFSFASYALCFIPRSTRCLYIREATKSLGKPIVIHDDRSSWFKLPDHILLRRLPDE